MTAKEYLNQALEMQSESNLKNEIALKLKSDVAYPKGFKESTGASSSHNATDTLGEAVTRATLYENEAKELEIKAIQKQIEIDETIGKLSNRVHREILRRKYILGQQLNGFYVDDVDNSGHKTLRYVRGVKDYIGYSYDWTKHLHTDALSEIEKIINPQNSTPKNTEKPF